MRPLLLFPLLFSLLPAGTSCAQGLDDFPGWDGSRIMGRSGPDVPYLSEPLFPRLPDFKRPVMLRSLPGSDPERLVVLELAGKAHSFENTPDSSRTATFLELGAHTKAYSFLFARSFPDDPSVYVLSNVSGPGHRVRTNVLSRFEVDLSIPRVRPQTETQLLRWWSAGHDGGDLAWGPDGMLYVSTGDGSAPNDPDNLGQTTDNLLGSILRLDPTGPSLVPNDNPFVNTPGVRPEVWSYGLRNPWRIAFGPRQNLWVGDNGNELWEMVHRSRKGANHGWSTFEGNHPYRPSNPLAGPTRVRAPVVVEHPHTEMRSLIGGMVSRDATLPELRGRYVYGDYVTGKVWSFRWDAGRRQVVERRPEADLRTQILAFCEDRSGRLIIVSNTGPLLRLRPAPPRARPPFPARLSETGLFADVATQALAPGVLPYEINHPQWLDGQLASRAVALPPEGKLLLRPRPHLSFELPPGSVAMQTLRDPTTRRPVETQLLLNDSQVWYAYTYAWNGEGTDAELVPAAGLLRKERRFPSRSECTICHTASSGFLLGFSPQQLQRRFDYTPLGGAEADQLDTLHRIGWLPKHLLGRAQKTSPYPQRGDASIPVAERARTWLHVHCAHCHREGGASGRAAFQLSAHLTDRETGCLDAKPLLDLWNTDNPRLVAPGDPDRSLLLKRIALRGPGQMPLFGSETVDALGVQVVRQWIQNLR